ncbi:hypothetical protein [Thalassospira alkalitolerans]|uniref:Uncharacterized protein n=1 Tax=Thalassospira alkalitolerans TaxID=1293890 RepID=A0A1Y2L6F4_9PROT|nr:hypothetical protein [Thalassospira alkalitolerans]OSQ43834.1 hypothetical protein TALK_19915 [Thalassospira alkalitolerans]|tara:strand:+ start:431851 stop:432042 length:192 start_codon:yes stop_codon:yes gene_type:complete
MALSFVVSLMERDGAGAFGAPAIGLLTLFLIILVISIVAYDLLLRLVSQLRPEIRNHNRVMME